MRRGFGNAVGVLGLLLIWLAAGCDAPRENPLDPGSDTYVPPVTPDHPAQINTFSILTQYDKQSQGDDPVRRGVAQAEISDLDGIDRVYLEVGDTLRMVIYLSAQYGLYRYEFNSSDEFGIPLQNLIGIPFRLIVYDKQGHVNISDRAMITRLLDQLPTPVYPNQDTLYTDSTQALRWMKFQSDYSISYTVQVRTASGSIVYQESRLPRRDPIPGEPMPVDSVQLTGEPLPVGEYRWNVWAYDNLGNMAKSATYIFFVREGANTLKQPETPALAPLARNTTGEKPTP